MKKMLASLVALTGLASASAFAVIDTQGFSSTLQSPAAAVKNAMRAQGTLLSTTRALDIKIINVTGQTMFAMLFPPHDPFNPILNDAVGHLSVDHFHHNDIADPQHVVIQNAGRNINILDQAICRYAVVTVFGQNYGQFTIDDRDCRCSIGVC